MSPALESAIKEYCAGKRIRMDVLQFPMRSISAIVTEWVTNPAVAAFVVQNPQEKMRRGERIYSSFSDSSFFGQIFDRVQQVFADPNQPVPVVVPLRLASDAFLFGTFTANSTHAFYLEFLSVPSSQRSSLMQTVCYLPRLPFKSSTDGARLLSRQLFQDVVSHLLDDVKTSFSSKPIIVTVADRRLRLLPVLSIITADYPEACLYACLAGGHLAKHFCVRCFISSEDALTTAGEPRSPGVVGGLPAVDAQYYGHYTVPNATFQIPFLDVFRSLAVDSMHLFELGLFPYLRDASEIVFRRTNRQWDRMMNHYFEQLPPCRGISILQGNSHRMNGREERSLSVWYPFAVAHVLGHHAVTVSWFRLSHLFLLARSRHFTERDLGKLQEAVRSFVASIADVKQIVNGVREGRGKSFNTPKLHQLQHLCECIRDFGPLLHISSQDAERRHQKTKGWKRRIVYRTDYAEILRQFANLDDEERQGFGPAGLSEQLRRNRNRQRLEPGDLYGGKELLSLIDFAERCEMERFQGLLLSYFHSHGIELLEDEVFITAHRYLVLACRKDLESEMLFSNGSLVAEKGMFLQLCYGGPGNDSGIAYGQLTGLFSVKVKARKADTDDEFLADVYNLIGFQWLERYECTCRQCRLLQQTASDGNFAVYSRGACGIDNVVTVQGVGCFVPHPFSVPSERADRRTLEEKHKDLLVKNTFAAIVSTAYQLRQSTDMSASESRRKRPLEEEEDVEDDAGDADDCQADSEEQEAELDDDQSLSNGSDQDGSDSGERVEGSEREWD